MWPLWTGQTSRWGRQGVQQGQYACSVQVWGPGCCSSKGGKGVPACCSAAAAAAVALLCGAALSLGVCMVVVALQAYLGPPSAQARYEILRSGVLELARAGLIAGEPCLVAPLNSAKAAH